MNIKRVLSKKTWTGRELGILEITNAAVKYKQRREGVKNPVPIVTPEEFRKMLDSIRDQEQARIYDGYISIHEWQRNKSTVAAVYLQQGQCSFYKILGKLESTAAAENERLYAKKMPLIMTRKQYEAKKAELLDEYFAPGGEREAKNPFALICIAIDYYLNYTGKDNPLKAIQKKYEKAPVKSEIVLNGWNRAAGNGYYTLSDGRRSDEMTAEEWKEAISIDPEAAIKNDSPAYRYVKGEYRTYYQLVCNHIDNPDEDEDKAVTDMEEKLDKLAEREGYSKPKWHLYETQPEGLTKWEVIKSGHLNDLYVHAMKDKDDETRAAMYRDFYEEFKDIADAILADIDKNYFNDASKIPPEKYDDYSANYKTLYEKDFYGFKADTDEIVLNAYSEDCGHTGIAILDEACGEHPFIGEGKDIVSQESILSDDIFGEFALNEFFPETPDYVDHIANYEETREMLIESYYYIQGFNKSVQLISEYYGIPEFMAYQLPIDDLITKIDCINITTHRLFLRIFTNSIEDDKKLKKLEVLRDVFPEIDYKKLSIPEDNITAAQEMLEGFKAFEEGNLSKFERLLCVLPDGLEGNEADGK